MLTVVNGGVVVLDKAVLWDVLILKVILDKAVQWDVLILKVVLDKAVL
jgi:hypothetical protein